MLQPDDCSSLSNEHRPTTRRRRGSSRRKAGESHGTGEAARTCRPRPYHAADHVTGTGRPARRPRGELCGAAADLARAALAALPAGEAADAVRAVLDRLAEDRLRIAVGGRMNAGKSTLVNALLGRRLAATAATECTMLVAWFRQGVQNRVEVRRLDGRRYFVPGHPGGGIPRDPRRLGSPRQEIAELVVEVADSALLAHRYSLVDTPGMDTLSGLDEVALSALARADALLYVMPHPGAGDAEALQSLRRQAHERMTALNVLGVLSRIDELGSGTGDPWPRAERVAATYTSRLTGMVSRIVPVAGLLAQTATGDQFTEGDTALLQRLAGEPRQELERALYSPDEFLGRRGGPLDTAERTRLLDLLGTYGIRVAVDSLTEADGARDARSLLNALRAASGVETLFEEIDVRFVAASDRLRAASALGLLEEVAATVLRGNPDSGVRGALEAQRTAVAGLRRHPLMRQTELASALAELATGGLRLSEADGAALVALATGGDAAACLGVHPDATATELAASSRAEAVRWRVVEASAPRAVQRHARTARELCEEFYFRARGD
ncbi:dynamin family protein [Streptomyces sp. NPDC002889]|uniref:dynamin family protein n=1 Tax=Streptomyces sp. NPDC002889 TaxID=3364669 RepID=UPI003695BE20